MSAATALLAQRIQRPAAPIADDAVLRYTGASIPARYGAEGVVCSAYTFDGDMWCYRVELPDGTRETWMDCEVELA